MIGGLKTSNSVKGFGNGFASKADRGLETTVLIKTTGMTKINTASASGNGNKLQPTVPMRSISVQKQHGEKIEKSPTILPKALRDTNAIVGGKKTASNSTMMQTIKEKKAAIGGTKDEKSE